MFVLKMLYVTVDDATVKSQKTSPPTCIFYQLIWMYLTINSCIYNKTNASILELGVHYLKTNPYAFQVKYLKHKKSSKKRTILNSGQQL